MFYEIKNPPQWLLDGLLQEHMSHSSSCPDCAVDPGKNHVEGCDHAHCLKIGRQRLLCAYGECGNQIWTGLPSGMQQCYDNSWVVYDDICQCIMLNLNRAAAERSHATHLRS